jgi:rhodanese-related sulfurtransferase
MIKAIKNTDEVNYKIIIYLALFLGLPFFGISQSKIDKTLERYNSNSVEYIGVEDLIQLRKLNPKVKLLDAREPSEYSISHIQGAIYAGYDDFTLEAIQDKISKNDTIVVYCSIGVRSENIGEELQEAGYQHVYNLYGGIFDWFNKEHDVYDQKGKSTKKIHAYSRFWSKYLERGQKVY